MDLSELIQSRARNQRKPRQWFEFQNLANGEAELFIYDFIGFDPWFGGVSAADFVRELRGMQANKILLRINSPGGDISEGVTIRNALREHPATIETHIDGLAASTASWVGLVADKIIMSPHSMMMIHEPWNIMVGDAASFRKEAEVLDKLGDDIARMFQEKAGGTVDEWRDAMREESWYTDQEAVDAGLADEIGGSAKVENRYDLAILGIFKNTPEELLGNRKAPPRRDAPKADNSEAIRARLEFERSNAERTMSRLRVA